VVFVDYFKELFLTKDWPNLENRITHIDVIRIILLLNMKFKLCVTIRPQFVVYKKMVMWILEIGLICVE
jgi:hypothetical protein